MQDPNPAAEDHSTTNPTEDFTIFAPSPLHQYRRAPTTAVVNPNPITVCTDKAGGGVVDFTGKCWSSAVAVRSGSSVAKKGRVGSGRPLSVGDKEDPLKGSSSVGARRKRVWKKTKCPCPVCEPSKKHADSTHRDDVKAGVVTDLNKVKEPVAEKTPMEGVDAAEKKKSEEKKRSGAAANGSAIKGVENSEAEAKTEPSEKEKRMKGVEEGKDDRKEEGEGSSAAKHKKAFAFDLNQLPSEE
ncbi:hypothetical protein L6164_020248 [Bauhinia variegata]|uniref:Uncharacterized protein n=1 Tax=Bauhinia variegata TaxID=167791 RepID=A0ACB9MUX1_BAUVA|nr:hypothetical protein L6164_020248 [Bauhinia variegata]